MKKPERYLMVEPAPPYEDGEPDEEVRVVATYVVGEELVWRSSLSLSELNRYLEVMK